MFMFLNKNNVQVSQHFQNVSMLLLRKHIEALGSTAEVGSTTFN